MGIIQQSYFSTDDDYTHVAETFGIGGVKQGRDNEYC